MKRFKSSVLVTVAAITLTISCKKDDNGADIAPPRDYAVQYATEKADIEEFLKGFYIVGTTGQEPYDIRFAKITDASTQTSIWDQTTYPLQSKLVTFSGVEYTVYYLVLNQGVGDAPNRGDNVLAAYRGTLMTEEGQDSPFDFLPYPQNISSLGEAILGWQEIVPLFKEGVYSSVNPENPATFTDYGAGVMFLPSALAYYNRSVATAPAYSSMVFSFKLYRVEDGDMDGDGLLNKYELNGTDPDPVNFDSDGDGIPNYLDTDDDNDGTPTLVEVTDPATDEVYAIDPATNLPRIPSCDPANPTVGIKRHLDPACDGL
ncbi:MAG: FKBP-type peptidyl-prolyl cis-trans isomerase [Flavobacterium sp.]